MKHILLSVLLLSLAHPIQLGAEESTDLHGLRPPIGGVELEQRAVKSLEDGFDFLVLSQNKDGSWGSHDPRIPELADFGFQLRNRGSHDAVRTACTAICAEALLSKEHRTAAEQLALDRAIEELLRVRKFAYHPGESFCTWGYGYKLGFLAQLAATKRGAELRPRIETAAKSCIDGLLRFQQHEGGWGYYAGVLQNSGSTSFNTAFFALSLKRAQEMGLDVPEEMIVDATRIVQRQRVPDGSFVYASEHRKNGPTILKNLGAGSRTVSSALALHKMGLYDEAALSHSLQVFDNGENYLESGRKLIVPHSAVHQISGYFFFFGYNYASEVAALLGDEIPQSRWDRFAWTMIRTQERNGSWWDTASGDYGDKWGTGFALLTLDRYLDELDRRQETIEQVESEPAEATSVSALVPNTDSD